MIPVILVMMLAGAGGVVYFLRGRQGGAVPAIDARLGRFGITTVPAIVAGHGDAGTSKRAIGQSLERLIGHGRYASKLAIKLERADLKATAAEFMSIWFAIFVGGSLLGLIIHGFLGLLALGLVALVGPWFYLSRRYKKRQHAFEGQLADMAQMMGNSMRAGFSILQSMELVSTEGPSPAKEEFQRVVTEVELGLPLDAALDHLLDRMPSEDLALMVVAINVQRQVGGNLAEILTVISETVRARVRFHRDLRALTAQGRYSSYVITALPIGVALVINILDQKYESYLYTTSLGHIMLGMAIGMIALGFFFLSKLANIEV